MHPQNVIIFYGSVMLVFMLCVLAYVIWDEKRKAKNELVIELPPNVQKEEAKLLLAIKLFETGNLSLEQAAKFAGHSESAFMELLGRYGVFDYPAEDLEQKRRSIRNEKRNHQRIRKTAVRSF